MGRTIVDVVFSELPVGRRREVMSAVAHYIAGVLDWQPMVEIVESLCETADWNPGDRVKTLRGSTRGVIVGIEKDGRVAWRPEGTDSVLLALPESLLREAPQKPAGQPKGRSARS